MSKRQKTVESSTYGSKLVAARIATELILELRCTLRMIGVLIDGPAMMLEDNMSVVLNTTVPSSVLKNKHCAIDYHRCREAIADEVLKFAHTPSTENIADIMTKPLTGDKFYKLAKSILFRASVHVKAIVPTAHQEQFNFVNFSSTCLVRYGRHFRSAVDPVATKISHLV